MLLFGSFLGAQLVDIGEALRLRFEEESKIRAPSTVRGLQKYACHFARMFHLLRSVRWP